MNLHTLGWSSHFAENIDVSSLARITSIHRSYSTAMTECKSINLYFPGNLNELPVVGDWATITPEFTDEQGRPAALIKDILPRSSTLSRWTDRGEQTIAANVDTVFIVTSANQDFKFNRLHRYILLVRKGGALPVIILSKVDLIEEASQLVEKIQNRLEVKVMGTSVVNDSGMSDVLRCMPEGTTSVFVGSSGVGKSTLTNRLLGESVQATTEIRADDDKGRHATTSRQMFLVPGSGLIIDTPGIREVQVFGDESDVLSTFPYIEELAQSCKFSNCQHETEPGCSIQKALSAGTLDLKDWQSFLKLQKEVEFTKRKSDKAEMANSKKRWKKVSQLAREMRKNRK